MSLFSALEAPNTKTNSLCVQSLLQALSDSDVYTIIKAWTRI